MTRLDAYLARLGAALPVSIRARVVDEVRAHLEDSIGAESGDEDKALQRFGDARVVAQRFVVEGLARRSRIAWRTALPLMVAALGLTAYVPTPMPDDALIGLALAAGAQVGFVALSVTLLRRVAGDDVLVARGSRVCVIAAGLVLGAWTYGFAETATRSGAFGRATIVSGVAVIGGLWALFAVTVGRTARIGDWVRAVEQAAAVRPAVGVGRSIDRIMVRPWLACAAVAVAAGIAMGAVHAIHHSFAGSAATGMTEAAMVVAGFVLAGPALGLRGRSKREVV
jgi:hypothetical protein